jgi:hypothetical protein
LERTVEKQLREALFGGEMAGAEDSNLPEPLKRAVLGAVHLLGYSIEEATREALALAEDEGPEAAKYLDASRWYTSLEKRLLASRPGSGTRPKVSVGKQKAKK